MLKEPRPGRVKTRLARDVGATVAARWFRHHALALIRRLGHDPRWQTLLAVSPDREGLASRLWPPEFARVPQGRGDLGRRMARLFRRLPPGPVVIVGADIPALGPEHVARAFVALGRAEAVIGPARDGGYWLVGLARRRRPPAGLFAGVRWSGPHALADTLATLPGPVARLEPLADVDELADLPGPGALCARLAGPISAPTRND